ncbi:shikimate dehydrogenase [Chelatococcus reniformis]|uniref:Shikimate dehydrogenase (NADP(+)) n=1 Tax=Chelatococcus reniformis TaxID=1494448 RepID=A0A916TXU3_9HYPH|nr:shikimate dehydrogenase [Chelatococcus reniformis]GGC51633.1 shikimate dehydrogenase (NADP(+)) [Chelatococcus reniformis]
MSPRACVIGDPIAHSRSPLIHRYWLAQHDIAGSYERQHITAAALPAFIAELRAGGWRGCNVTVPHKGAVAAQVDELTPVAARLGAANTLWLEEGRLRADNTDVAGFMDNLDQAAPGWRARAGAATVLGAGGAARAAVHGLLERGVGTVHVVNRSVERATQLAQAFGPRVRPAAWDKVGNALAGSGLLVNTTSLGMSGQPSLALDLSPLPAGATVYDIVYVPLETPLLAQARARDLEVVDGLGMLLHQAVPGFERWFGVRPEVTKELRDLLVADIEGTR